MDLKKQAVPYIIGNIVYLIALWLLTVITTQLLGYEDVGALTLAMTIGNVVVNIQLYGVRGFQGSDMAFHYKSNEYVWTRVITIIAGLVIGVLICFLTGYSVQLSYTIVLFLLIKTSETFSDVLFGNIQRVGRLDLAGYSMCIRGFLIVLFFLFGVFFFKKLNGALLIVALSVIMLSLFIDLPFHYKAIPESDRASLTSLLGILKDCFPLFLTAVIPICIIAFPRIILERFYGTVILGFYGNVSTPALLLITLIPPILTTLLPAYGNSYVTKNHYNILRIWKNSVFVTIALSIVCFLGTRLLAERLMVWLYTEKILPYVYYLYFIMIAMALYALIMCNNTALVSMRKNRVILITSILGFVVCLLLSLPLVRNYGIDGAVAVLYFSFGSQLVVQIIWLLRIFSNTRKENA